MSGVGNASKRDETITSEKLRAQTTWTLVGVGLIAAFLLLAYLIWFGWINALPAAREDASVWGTFGDFIGGILNPLVAFLALYWLTRSIEIQRQELSDTKKALVEQSETAKKQRFEDTFFALLDQHNAVLRYLTEESERGDANTAYSVKIRNAVLKPEYASLAEANREFSNFNGYCGHYFRILYQLLKFIATRCPDDRPKSERSDAHSVMDKPPGGGMSRSGIAHRFRDFEGEPSIEEKLYSNIVRSFLDLEMTQLLAVNCFCENDQSDYWGYKCLLERYSLLEHMSFLCGEKESSALKDALAHYDGRAFGNNPAAAEIRAR